MKSLLLAALLMVTNVGFAASAKKFEEMTVETFEVTTSGMKMVGTDVNGSTGTVTTEVKPQVDRLQRANEIIATAKDFVALGQSIYELVQRGKPSNTTEYAPISVVPRDPISKEYIDPFELEGFSMPVEKKFVTVIKSGMKEAVRFEYMVVYSYGGSYNGAGKWITGAQIIPSAVKTSYGVDFSATMKVSGILNHGTKADPIAGVMLVVKYTMNSWGKAEERNDSFHITGNGQFKSYIAK
jgi:hypothetical protein